MRTHETMNAVICPRYGPPEVLILAEVPKPAPADDEILIRIHATTVTAGDVRIRGFTVPVWQWLPARLYLGLTKPKRPILGMELAGEVEAVGSKVTGLAEGDRVFAFTGFGFGAYADYICMKESGSPTGDGLVARLPDTLTYALGAAATGGALTAWSFLRKVGIASGQRVLIYGASGSVGTFAVQLACHAGAQVTGVCSTANLEMVRSLGAEQVIDYNAGDFTAHDGTYDIIFDAVAKTSKAQSKRLLAEDGRYLSVHGSANVLSGDLEYIRGLLESGDLKPVIDRTYPIAQIVEAHRYVDQGHKKGNVVVMVRPNGAN